MPKKTPAAGDTARTPTVLNVDDRPATLYVRERILREGGFVVRNAGTGSEAMREARMLHPSIILLDVHLPDMDGRALCEQIKQDPELSDIPVVLISSTLTSDAHQLEGIRWARADGFIKEPVEPAALINTLKAAMRLQPPPPIRRDKPTA